MRQEIHLAEGVDGRYTSVPPILRIEDEFDYIVREPLEELRVAVGEGSLGRRVNAELGPVQVGGRCVGLEPGTLEIPLRWRAACHPVLFPTMRGALVVQDTGHDTLEVSLVGGYRPPFGRFGARLDRLLGRRVAMASLEQYLQTVATRLATKLAEHTPPRARRRIPSHLVQRTP
jgi:hypothetical protein